MRFTLHIDPNAEEEIIARVRKRSALTDDIEEMVRAADKPTVLTAYGEDDILVLQIREIECIFTEDGRTWAQYSDGKRYRVRARLYEIEDDLPPDFIRINKSAIANRRKIRRFLTQLTGAVDAEFNSGHRDYVSRRCFSELRRRLDL